MTVREGGELERMMQRTEGTDKGGEGISSVEPLTGTHRSVQRWRGAMIRKTDPVMGSSFSRRWGERPNGRSIMAVWKHGNERASRSG